MSKPFSFKCIYFSPLCHIYILIDKNDCDKEVPGIGMKHAHIIPIVPAQKNIFFISTPATLTLLINIKILSF